MQHHGNALTSDALLLWLNDRLRKSVHVSVEVEKGDLDVTVLEAEGELLHWREIAIAEHVAAARYPREDLIGSYAVGAARFDLSDLEHLDAWAPPGRTDEIVVELAENVALRIIEQVDA